MPFVIDASVTASWCFPDENDPAAEVAFDRLAEFLADLDRLPIRLDYTPQSSMVLALARKHRLTVYDAAYLELARRLGKPLATLDQALAAAAQSDGVALIGDIRS